MSAIQNHEQLIKYLKEKGWERESAALYHKDMGETYGLTIYLNPFHQRHFTIHMNMPYQRDENMIFYKMRDKIQNVIEEIENEVTKVQKSVSKWREKRRESVKKEGDFYRFIGERDSIFLEDKGCYQVTLKNLRKVYLFILPNHVAFEVIMPVDKNEEEFVERKIKFEEKEMIKFYEWIKDIEQTVSFLDGWITPKTEKEFDESLWGNSFKDESGKNLVKAKRYRDIVMQTLKRDYFHHVVPFIYNNDDKMQDKIEFEISKEKPFLKSVKNQIVNVFKELSEKYDFLKISGQYSYMDVYAVDLNQAEEDTFKEFIKDLSDRLDNVLSLINK